MRNSINTVSFFMLTVCFFVGYGQNTFPSNGNIGIGTLNPQQKLHIHGSTPNITLISGAAPGIIFSPISTNNLSLAGIGLSTINGHYHTTSLIGDFNIRSGGGKDIVFGTLSTASATNGNECMRIKNDGTLQLKGNKGVVFSDYGGGFKMIDNSWIRTSGNKSFYHNRGIMRTDGTFQVGRAGNRFIVKTNGEVGIGVNNTNGYKLAVKGNIITEELKIRTYESWPDYVFSPDYSLKTLKEIENHIKKEGHLPNIPSAKEVKEKGINIGEMNAKLLQKIEELTLYLIEINKKVYALESENVQLKGLINSSKI
ncbi:hypothetical protein ACFSTE_11465 [Aquimarina hainanensis]|uniref:BZIP transcription factor n=1 Tax=Aquimarina hainanensis TaxID=1578017 RepID=A0ABW5N7H0_9FLAO